MDTSQDLMTTTTSIDDADDSLMYDTESPIMAFVTQKFDQVTESEMKKIEAQKMEGEITIKTLEQTYRESKQNLLYAQKKLEEARKKAASQVGQINQLMRANTAIVEKFNELKNYQNEIILSNTCEAEDILVSCKNRNVELSKTLEMILDRDNYLESLKRDIRDKKAVVNDNAQREIEEKKAASAQKSDSLARLRKENERVKMLLNHEMSDHNYNEALIDERVKRTVQLEEDEEIFQNKIAKELETLEQEKQKFQDFLNNNLKIFDEKNALISKVQTELSAIEKLNDENNESLNKLEAKRSNLLEDVRKKRQVVDSLKNVFDENVVKINEDQVKVDSELEIVRNRFVKSEEAMHAELESLNKKINDKKQLVQKLESRQQELTKLKERRLSKQIEVSNADQELQIKAKESANELKKYELILSDKNRAQNELDSKIRKLQEEKNNVRLKLESLDKDKAEKTRNNSIQSNGIGKTRNLNEIRKDKESAVFNKREPQAESSSSTRSKFLFGFDDSDESEDEKFFKNTSLEKLTSIKTPCNKKPEYNYEPDSTNVNKKTESILPTSDRLFEELLSKTPTSSRTTTESKNTANNEYVFKVPQPYSTPFKRRHTTKYNKK